MEAEVRSALAASHLRGLPPDVLAALTTGAVRTSVPAGTVTHHEGERLPHLDMVVVGLMRVFVRAPDGRTLTVRYCRPGSLLGTATVFAGPAALPGTASAVVDAEVLRMSATVAAEVARTDARVAGAFLEELSERVLRFMHEIPGGAFASVRQRVARHLLDLASDRAQRGAPPDVGELVAPVSQQELAESVGTVREVVVRVLREMRQDGLVRTGRDGIVLLDPARLSHEQGWNAGS